MSPITIAYILFVLVGLGFGCAPFLGRLRRLPRWIRVAFVMVSLSFIGGTGLDLALHLATHRVSDFTYRFLHSHTRLIYGIGIGIILLLIFSGEIFKALWQLDVEARREHGAKEPNEK
jgi:hypothetical protein